MMQHFSYCEGTIEVFICEVAYKFFGPFQAEGVECLRDAEDSNGVPPQPDSSHLELRPTEDAVACVTAVPTL